MARLFTKVKNVFSLRPRNFEPSSSNTPSASCDPGHQRSSAATPSYHHAAAVQPPVYRAHPSQLQAPANSHPNRPSAFHQQAKQIAQIQVGGMGRGGASYYPTSYEPTQTSGTSSAAWSRPSYATADQTTISTYRDGGVTAALDTGEGKDLHANVHGQYPRSTWQGKPNGTAYDRRLELTQEDEDMWARMAM